MTYDQQILQVLTEAGECGVSVQAIAKHVYNMNCTFFVQPDFEEIRTYVQQYLLRNSKSQQSLIESTARQLLLQFRDEKEEEREEEKPQQDLSLDLFD